MSDVCSVYIYMIHAHGSVNMYATDKPKLKPTSPPPKKNRWRSTSTPPALPPPRGCVRLLARAARSCRGTSRSTRR